MNRVRRIRAAFAALTTTAVTAAVLTTALPVARAGASAGSPAAEVLPGHSLQFPRDFGSHPQFGVEWWYLTGWLTTAAHEQLGFQVTFFRVRTGLDDDNPSAFAPRQLLIAHCAISDPTHGSLWHDQRIRRAGLGLTEAQTGNTTVWIDDWQLKRSSVAASAGKGVAGDVYETHIRADQFDFDLQMTATQPPLLNGVAGYSQKGPAPQSASYYYSVPHLAVSGRITRAQHVDAVSGEAWLDHEWSSQYLDPAAVGWDWIGINLDDGGALMAFRIRDRQGNPYWAGATLRDAHGVVQTFDPGQIQFTPQQRWRSPRTGATYPVSWHVQVGTQQFEIDPLMNDQENDARLSSGSIYWEGAVRAQQANRSVGRGYLELTGYGQPLSLRGPTTAGPERGASQRQSNQP